MKSLSKNTIPFILLTEFSKEKILLLVGTILLIAIILLSASFFIYNTQNSIVSELDEYNLSWRTEAMHSYQMRIDKIYEYIEYEGCTLEEAGLAEQVALLQFYIDNNKTEHDYFTIHDSLAGIYFSNLFSKELVARPFFMFFICLVGGVIFSAFLTRKTFLIGHDNNIYKILFLTTLTRSRYWLANFKIWARGILAYYIFSIILIYISQIGVPHTEFLSQNGLQISIYTLNSVLLIKIFSLIFTFVLVSSVVLLIGNLTKNSVYSLWIVLTVYFASIIVMVPAIDTFGKFNFAIFIVWLSATCMEMWDVWWTYLVFGINLLAAIIFFIISYQIFKRRDM